MTPALDLQDYLYSAGEAAKRTRTATLVLEILSIGACSSGPNKPYSLGVSFVFD
jgi:hypothetical protein